MSEPAEKRSPCAETVAVPPDITGLLLADLVEAGVDEPIARTLLTLAARAGENMRLTRENERLRAVMQGILDDADERYYTLRNDEWFLVRLRNTLARSDGYPATDG